MNFEKELKEIRGSMSGTWAIESLIQEASGFRLAGDLIINCKAKAKFFVFEQLAIASLVWEGEKSLSLPFSKLIRRVDDFVRDEEMIAEQLYWQIEIHPFTAKVKYHLNKSPRKFIRSRLRNYSKLRGHDF